MPVSPIFSNLIFLYGLCSINREFKLTNCLKDAFSFLLNNF